MTEGRVAISDDDNSTEIEDHSSTENNDRGNWKQYYCCFTMSMLSLSKGFVQGWASPMIQVLLSDQSPTGKMDESTISIMQTMSTYSAIAGVILVVITLVRYGLKVSAYIQAVLNIVGWILLLFASSPTVLFAGRFLSGLIASGDILCSFFLSEISSDRIRGTLIAICVFGINLGTLLGFLLGAVCSYTVFNVICLIPSVIFPVLFFSLPEVPPVLLRFGKVEEAIQSFIWYREVSYHKAKRNIDELRIDAESNIKLYQIFKETANKRAMIILTFVVAYSVLCGTAVINSYTSEIFRRAECSLLPNQSALILASTGFIASIVSFVTIDLFGRRFLVLSSFLTMSLSLFGTLIYFLGLNQGWFSAQSTQWLIYVSLCAFAAAQTIGITSVSEALGAEMVASKTKKYLWLIAGLSSLLLNVITLLIYAQITQHLNYYVNFIPGAVFSTVAVVIAWFIIPETKGKTLTMITAELSRTNYWTRKMGNNY